MCHCVCVLPFCAIPGGVSAWQTSFLAQKLGGCAAPIRLFFCSTLASCCRTMGEELVVGACIRTGGGFWISSSAEQGPGVASTMLSRLDGIDGNNYVRAEEAQEGPSWLGGHP